MSSSGGGLQPTAILRRPPPGVEPFRVWVPSPVSCPGGATPPPPVDDRSGDLVSGACTGALPRAHTPCTGRTRLVGRSLFNLCLARPARRPAATLCSGAASRGATEVASPRCCWSTTPPSRCRRPRSPALKGIAVSGNASKLHVIFTHFDQVKGNNLPGLQRPRAARPGVGRERAEVHRRRAGPGGRARPAPTDRPGALLRRRYPGSARRQEQGRLVFDPAARRGPEPLGGPRTRRRCRHEPSRVQPHEPVAGPDGGSQDLPHPLARHPRSGLQPGRT
jgi:hypothetical protein